MADTYTWGIANLERHIPDGIVYTVHYTVNAERIVGSETYNTGAYGSIGLAAPEGSYIPFADLLPDTVIGWVKDSFGPEKVEEIEQALSSNLDQQETPTHESGVPW